MFFMKTASSNCPLTPFTDSRAESECDSWTSDLMNSVLFRHYVQWCITLPSVSLLTQQNREQNNSTLCYCIQMFVCSLVVYIWKLVVLAGQCHYCAGWHGIMCLEVVRHWKQLRSVLWKELSDGHQREIQSNKHYSHYSHDVNKHLNKVSLQDLFETPLKKPVLPFHITMHIPVAFTNSWPLQFANK